MRVGSLIDQHAVDRRSQVRAVVEVEAAQVKLIRLALAAVLADDEPGNRLQNFAGAVDSSRFQLLLRHQTLIGRFGDAELAVARCLDGDRGKGFFVVGGVDQRVVDKRCAQQGECS